MKKALIIFLVLLFVIGCTQGTEDAKSTAKEIHEIHLSRLKAIEEVSQQQKQYEELSMATIAESEKKLSKAVTEEGKKEASDQLFIAKVLLESNKELEGSVNFYKQEIESLGKKIDNAKSKEEINDLILKESGVMYAFGTSIMLNAIAITRSSADFSKRGAEINPVTSSVIENTKKLLQENLSISKEEFERIVAAQGGTEDIKKELEKVPEFKQDTRKAMKKALSYGVDYFNKEIRDLQQRFQQELNKENEVTKLVLAQKIHAVKQLKESN